MGEITSPLLSTQPWRSFREFRTPAHPSFRPGRPEDPARPHGGDADGRGGHHGEPADQGGKTAAQRRRGGRP
ncbi:hypothetical protein ABZ609_19455, partial [Streptomyces rubiginosohelvolus]|uniref:hypothetical protein n=1 Tax=Streptomyces rubiginosohelvolus TaxID=67362 RepID=UPI0033EEFC31